MMPGNFPTFHNMTQAEAFAWEMAPPPGIRLTLTQGTAITTADVTGATSIYAEPVTGGLVPMFQDAAGIYPCIRKLLPSTISLALGTLASATIPNDVFAYDNNGAVGLEKVAWTNGTTRATALDLVGGRYYKNANYSRLFLGSFYPSSTTTVDDSFVNRTLFNMYNRVQKDAAKPDSGNHTYSTITARPWNNNAADTQCNAFIGIVDQLVRLRIAGFIGMFSAGGTVNAAISMNWNGSTLSAAAGNYAQSYQNSVIQGSLITFDTSFSTAPILGLNSLYVMESWSSGGGTGYWQAGGSAIEVRN